MVNGTSLLDKDIGARVAAELKNRRCSKRAAALKIGISEWALGRRIRGEVPFRTPELCDLAELLDMTVAQLLGEA